MGFRFAVYRTSLQQMWQYAIVCSPVLHNLHSSSDSSKVLQFSQMLLLDSGFFKRLCNIHKMPLDSLKSLV